MYFFYLELVHCLSYLQPTTDMLWQQNIEDTEDVTNIAELPECANDAEHWMLTDGEALNLDVTLCTCLRCLTEEREVFVNWSTA